MSQPTVSMTPQELQDLMTAAVTAAVKEAVKPSPLEAKKIAEEEERDKRRTQLMLALGIAEEEAEKRRKAGCTHTRWPANAGKLAGFGAPRGQGEWTTGGQAYQDGTAAVICLRCATVKRFRPTAEVYSAIIQNGLLGAAFPSEEQVIAD